MSDPKPVGSSVISGELGTEKVVRVGVDINLVAAAEGAAVLVDRVAVPEPKVPV